MQHAAAHVPPRRPTGCDPRKHSLESDIRLRLGHRRVDAGRQVASVECQQDCVDLKTVESRARIKQFLQVLAVVAFVQRQVQTAAKARDAQRRLQVGGGRRAKDCQPNRRCRRTGRRLGKNHLHGLIERVGLDEIQPMVGEPNRFVPRFIALTA